MILFKILDFLRSLDRFEVLIRVIISEFYMAWRKYLLKYLLIGGGHPPMSRRCRLLVDKRS